MSMPSDCSSLQWDDHQQQRQQGEADGQQAINKSVCLASSVQHQKQAVLEAEGCVCCDKKDQARHHKSLCPRLCPRQAVFT